MIEIHLSLLRGICQLPAYVAHANGIFWEQGLVAHITISPSVAYPRTLCSGAAKFAVIPWTRVAAAERDEAPLKVVCGSGFEEAAIVFALA
jgi:ABC-type nitrate/sulfonate/bicarbonate transport system substrate-binding protein